MFCLLMFSEFVQEFFIRVAIACGLFCCIALSAFSHRKCSFCILGLTHADIGQYIIYLYGMSCCTRGRSAKFHPKRVFLLNINSFGGSKFELKTNTFFKQYRAHLRNMTHLVKNLVMILFPYHVHMFNKGRVMSRMWNTLSLEIPCCFVYSLLAEDNLYCIECYSIKVILQSRSQCCSAIRGIGSMLIG